MLHRPNKTAGAKRGLIETSAYDALLPYVAGPDEPPRYALHFGTVEKIGVNPRSKYDTPLAVCAFPLTEEIFEQFLKIDLPFAQQGAKYLYLLEIRPEARVFYSTPRFFNRGVGPEYVGYAATSKKFFYSTQPKDYHDSPQYASEQHQTVARAAQWGRKLMNMGIGVWVDADREGILHGNEPSQVMFFNPRSYSVVFSMDNPKRKFELRYGRDWRKQKDMRGLDLRGLHLLGADLRGLDLRGSHLLGADLRYMDLGGANLAGVNLTGADLSEAVLTGAILTDAILTEAILESTTLEGARLEGADLTDAHLYDARLKGAKYDESTIWPDSVRDVLRVWRGDKDLTKAHLFGASLVEADLRSANLTGANLIDANLHDAHLTDAKLIDAHLYGAYLYRALLRGADLRGADLTEAELEGITYDENTKWPEGFTPPPSTPRPNRR
jgi:uncharacterized protein YjbI with pentapeptide repeats